MPARTSVFIATSLDGFISRTDGSIDWLMDANGVMPAGEDCGYAGFIATVDRLVMGNNTFRQVLTFDPWPYGELPVVVMSRGAVDIPERLRPTVTCTNESPGELVSRLGDEGARHLYIDGGMTIRSFLSEGLIDELIITVIPLLLGEGRPLFGPLPHDVSLRHVSSKVYAFGFVQHRYQVEGWRK